MSRSQIPPVTSAPVSRGAAPRHLSILSPRVRVLPPLPWRGLASGLLLLSLAFAPGCNKGEKDADLEESLIQEAQRGDLTEEIIESGKITPWYEVQIKARVSGEVRAVEAQEGEAVKKGQLLMTLVDSDYARQVAIAQTNKREAEVRLAAAQLEVERNQAAYEARGVSKYDLDKANQNLQLAQVTLDRTKVQLQTETDQLNYTRIYSPMDGMVTQRNVEPGEMVTAGVTATVNGEPLLTIAQMDKLLLELSLNQVDVARVQLGHKATVILDAYRDQPIQGEVTSIAAAAHTDTSKGLDVFKVKVSVDPGQAKVQIKPGMTAEVRIHIGNYAQVIKVPIETVFEENGKSYLYIVKDDPEKPGKKKKEKVEVKLGHRGSSEVEITSGLEQGQKIYTKGDTKDLEMKM